MKAMKKRVISLVCMIALVVTSAVPFNAVSTKADTTTTVVTTNDGRNAIKAEAQDAEINFALNKEAEVSRLTTQEGGTDLGILTDAAFSTTNAKTTIIEIGRAVKEDRWMQVDLGEAYDSTKIDRVVAMYKTNNSGPINGNETTPQGTYKVQFSLNGMDYVDVAEVSGFVGANNAVYVDQISLTDDQKEAIPYTRYVRIYSTREASAYGLQVKDFAVLTDGETKVSDVEYLEVEKLDNAKSLTVTSDEYNQLEYTFEAADEHEDYEYIAYIDGVKDLEAKKPGEKYVVTGLSSGTHKVKIVSVKEGLTSEGIVEEVAVSDPKELMTTERNIALGATATLSSLRVDGEKEDNPANLTDGKLNTQCRSKQADSTVEAVIDLGAECKANLIEMIAFSYIDNRYAKEYTVSYSLDGEEYEEVCQATGDSNFQYERINSVNYSNEMVRYIKIEFAKPVTANYGFQFYEIAVITKDKTLDDAEVSLAKEEYGYTGSEVLPEINATYAGKDLVKDKDYVIVCEDNVNAGTAKAKVVGAGSFAGTKTFTYTITSVSLDDVEAKTSVNHSEELPNPENEFQMELTYGEFTLVDQVDYTYEIVDDADNNVVNVNITASEENFVGTKQVSIDYAEFPVYEAENVSFESTSENVIEVSFENPATILGSKQVYDVYLDEELVEENVAAGNFTYDNQTAGQHVVQVIAKSGEKVSEGFIDIVTVAGMDISQCTLEIAEIMPIYSGEAVEMDYVAKNGETVLELDKDYTCEYLNNVNAGTATIRLTGIGLYEGVLEGTFEIAPMEITEDMVDFAEVQASYEETGLEITPVVTVKDLVANEAYTVTYENNVAPGTATIVIEGKGNYTGKITKEFTITKKPDPTTVAPETTVKPTNKTDGSTAKVPATKVTKASKKKSAKKLSVTLKAVNGASKYQIQVSAAKTFKKVLVNKTVSKVKATVSSKKIKKAKKLFVRARAIKVVNGKKVYSDWSKAKKVKIK